VLATVAFPSAAQAGPPDWLVVEDGVTQPVFSLDDAITETLFVETVVDSDQDGRRDLVRIHVSRPGETETEGIDVPVVFEHSPYRGEFGDAENHPVDFDVLPQENLRPGQGGDRTQARQGWGRSRLRADLPGGLDDRYVPRGYAVILDEGVGSAGSDGCPTIGDSDETLSTRAVIDWLNGRARAFDADGQPLRADWTTGAVGVTGVSYDATLPTLPTRRSRRVPRQRLLHDPAAAGDAADARPGPQRAPAVGRRWPFGARLLAPPRSLGGCRQSRGTRTGRRTASSSGPSTGPRSGAARS
jgi:hypothetical protein